MKRVTFFFSSRYRPTPPVHWGFPWAPIKGGASGWPNPVTPIHPTPCGLDSGLSFHLYVWRENLYKFYLPVPPTQPLHFLFARIHPRFLTVGFLRAIFVKSIAMLKPKAEINVNSLLSPFDGSRGSVPRIISS